jgi:hypothetical protein
MQVQATGASAWLDQGMSSTASGAGSARQASGTASAGAGASVPTPSSNAASAAASTLADIYYDIRDTNKDGYVSSLENLAYTLTHPGESAGAQAVNAAGAASLSAYNRQGALSSTPVQSLVDLFA